MDLHVELTLDDGTAWTGHAHRLVWRERGTPGASRHVRAESVAVGDRVRTESEAPVRTVAGKRYVRRP